VSYRWEWEVFLRDTGGDQTYLAWMMSSWGWTLAVAGCAWILALALGSAVGTLRTVPSPWISRLAAAWVELFRNIPVLVQVFLWYHVIPAFITPLREVPSFVLVVFALGLFSSARVAEQVRAGIESLARGQQQAGLALGLTLPQTYGFVLLPMAFRIVIPPLTSEAMNIVKNSSVAFAVSVGELTMFAMQAQEETSRGIEVYLAVTGLYAVSALAVNRVMALIEARSRVPGYMGGAR
jgi:glutamate/aspartate transport system permease protein